MMSFVAFALAIGRLSSPKNSGNNRTHAPSKTIRSPGRQP